MIKKCFKKNSLKKEKNKGKFIKAPKALNGLEDKGILGETNSPELLLSRMEWLAAYFERLNFGKYVEILHKPRRIFAINFFAGVARGFGFAIGFTLLGFLAVYILNRLNLLNLPIIGDFIAQLLHYVEMSQGARV